MFRVFVSVCLLSVGMLLLLPGRVIAELKTPNVDSEVVVVTSLPPQAYFIRRLVPKGVKVEVMLRPGVPHEMFEPTISQLRAFSRAKAYFKVGHPGFTFESVWMEKFLKEKSLPILVNTAENISLRNDDIHIWLSPAIVRRMIQNMSTGLVSLFPEHAAEIRNRTEESLLLVDNLHAEIQEKIQVYRGRSFLVFHPSWGYFAEEFGLHQMSIEVDGKEPGLGKLESIIQSAKKAGIRNVILEPAISSPLASEVARRLGGKVVVADPLAEDWPQNLREFTTMLEAQFSAAPLVETAQ